MTAMEQVDPFTAVGAHERQRAYAALASTGPVRRVQMPGRAWAWLVTGYAEVRQVLADDRFAKAPGPANLLAQELAPHLAPGFTSHVLNRDGQDHARLRRLVGAAFTTRRVAALAPRIQEVADELLDAIDPDATIDLIDAYAFPLPMTVICELIGVPTEARADFRRWSETLIGANFADRAVFVATLEAEAAFARDLVASKRRDPQDDLLSALVAVRDSGDVLTDDELNSMILILVIAGHETTVNLIGNGVLALLTHPHQLARLLADPALLPGAVEELLRFDGPVQVTFPLVATESVRVGPVQVAAGELVLPALLAANRDPVHTDDPSTLDLTRDTGSHVAFGHGIHHCLGAPLARLEARIALGTLLARFPGLRLAVPADTLTWRPNFLIHGLTELPVSLL
jgi:cytochrome P450